MFSAYLHSRIVHIQIVVMVEELSNKCRTNIAPTSRIAKTLFLATAIFMTAIVMRKCRLLCKVSRTCMYVARNKTCLLAPFPKVL